MPFIMIFDSVGVISDAIRGLLMLFDWVVYELLSILMQVIFDIANFPLDMMAIAEKIATRIYLLLAIFMLFKIMISLLGYLVNPDSITDKQQGAGKLISRVIVSLLMLILLPTFFGRLLSLQSAVLDSLPRIVLGTKTGYSENDVSKMGENISWSIFKSFFYYNTSCSDNQDGEMIKDEMKSTTLTEEEKAKKSKMGFALSTINDKCPTNKSYYLYSYKPLISTIAGGFACYVLIGIAITVAIRMFKLMILRIIAPIPLISYMDPKLSKDGPFNKWLKALFSTWLELFINLGILYLVIYLANELLSTEGNLGLLSYVYDLGFFRGSVVLIFIILGLLMFAKQAPKFLLDTLGIKSNNNGFVKALGLSSAVLGGIGTTAATFGARESAYKNSHDGSAPGLGATLGNVSKSMFSGISGIASAGNAVISSDKPTLRTGFDAQQKYNQGELNRINSGSTAGGRMGSIASSIFTGRSSAERMQLRQKELEDANKAFKDYKSTIESRFDGNDSFTYMAEIKDENGHTVLSTNAVNWLELERYYQAAEQGDASAKTWLQTKAGVSVEQIRQYHDEIHRQGYAAFEHAVIKHETDASGKVVEDSVLWQAHEDVVDKTKGITVDKYNKDGTKGTGTTDLHDVANEGGYKNIKGAMGDISGTLGAHVRSKEYKSAMADSKEVNKK